MTATVPLSLLKAQLNITHSDDDELLSHKLATAEIWIAKHTGTPFISNEPVLTEVVLQLAAYWYQQREAASFSLTTLPVPFGVYQLLSSYREQVTGHVSA